MDGYVAYRAEAAIDPADDAMCRSAQLLVLGHVGARGHSDLQQHDLVRVRLGLGVRGEG